MRFPFWGNMFPYTKFNEINLDWIMGKLAELVAKTDKVVEEATEQVNNIIQNSLETFSEATESATQAAVSEVNTAATAAESSVQGLVSDARGEISAAVTAAESSLNETAETARDDISSYVTDAEANISSSLAAAESRLSTAANTAIQTVDTKAGEGVQAVDDGIAELNTIISQASDEIEDSVYTNLKDSMLSVISIADPNRTFVAGTSGFTVSLNIPTSSKALGIVGFTPSSGGIYLNMSWMYLSGNTLSYGVSNTSGGAIPNTYTFFVLVLNEKPDAQ